MLTFNALGLSPNLLRGIEELGFIKPTPIQEKVIPSIFDSNTDLIGLAQTGTGKTAAFGLPLLDLVDPSKKHVQTLVLSPTRELCVQIAKDLETYSKHMDQINVVPVYGGASMDTQIRALKRGAQIVVATPGRMIDLLKRKATKVNEIGTVVLDEADEMLNMGFRDELDEILETTPDSKRTLLFSATMSNEVARIARNYLKNPEKITIGKQNSGAENIRHIYYQIHARDRYIALKRIADINPDIYGIVFCRTRMETKDIADKLIRDGYNADALHGDLSQAQRDHVMKRFRERSLQMLVATDVAARGLDVNDISHVINYNLPDELEVYTHRSGRTGRADKSGVSITLINFREKHKIQRIESMTGKRCEKMPVPSGEEICKKQLFNMIDRMEKTQVDEAKIEPFMETVNKKLDWMSKEEVIKHFISIEFNRFLEYYKNAPDLNKKAEEGGKDKDGKKSRNRRGNENSGDFTRFFLNVGKKDGLQPKKMIGLINDHTRNRDISIGHIDLKDSFSFFEVDSQYADKVRGALSGKQFNGRKMNLEIAEKPKNGGRPAGKGKKKKKKRY